MQRVALAAVVLLLAGVTAACGGATRPHEAGPGTIVFTSNLSGNEGVYAVRPDGSGLSRLLTFPSYGAEVIWNPKGTEALVFPEYGKQFRSYILDWPSRKKHTLRLKGLDPSNYAAWSPDGEKLLLTGDSVASYDLATRRMTTLPSVSPDAAFAWSGDSKSVLDMGANGGVVLSSSATDGSLRVLVDTSDPNADSPQSSADGKWISFDDFSGMRDRYYVIRRSGRGGKRVVAVDASGVSAAWSPTGESLAYTTTKGTGVIDFATGRHTFVAEPADDPSNNPPGWSPDGNWVLYWRFDLGYGASSSSHLQLWAMHPDGTAAHAVTHAFTPDWGNGTETWVAATLHGTPLPRVSLVTPPEALLTTTDLPVVALGARGSRVVVATGFGAVAGGPKYPRGPVLSIGPGGEQAVLPAHGCLSIDTVFLSQGQTGYVCTNNAVGYGYDDAVRLGRKTLVHTQGGEFTGRFLSGVAAIGSAVAFGVQESPPASQIRVHFAIRDTRIYESHGSHLTLVGKVKGRATVESTDGDRIAILGGKPHQSTISVLSLGGSTRIFPMPGPAVVGARLDGNRLVVLQDGQLASVEVSSGQTMYYRTTRGIDLGAGPTLDDVGGGLVAYSVGAAVHVMRLSDGREVVLDTPGATDGVQAAFGSKGLYVAYNKAYATHPGRVGFIARAALERAISTHGRLAR